MERGIVTHLLTATAAGEPMQSHQRIEIVPGVGIPGDRYATREGHWSDPQWPDQELTLVESELAEELGLAPELLRRNIVTIGANLEDLIGQDFTLGTARLRAVRICDPCAYLETLIRPGLFAQLNGRGGIRVEIVEGGAISIGDTINQMAPDAT